MDPSLPPSTPSRDQTLEDLIVHAAALADQQDAVRVARVRALRSANSAPPAVSTESTPVDKTPQFSRPDPSLAAPTFYSVLRRVVDAKMPTRASVTQVLQIVKNPNSGVKADEVKWSGLETWLNDRREAGVTKADVLAFLDANRLELKEIVRGELDIEAEVATIQQHGYHVESEGMDDDAPYLVDKKTGESVMPEETLATVKLSEPAEPQTLWWSGSRKVENVVEWTFSVTDDDGNVVGQGTLQDWPVSYDWRGDLDNAVFVVNSQVLQNGRYPTVAHALQRLRSGLRSTPTNSAGGSSSGSSRSKSGTRSTASNTRSVSRRSSSGGRSRAARITGNSSSHCRRRHRRPPGPRCRPTTSARNWRTRW